MKKWITTLLMSIMMCFMMGGIVACYDDEELEDGELLEGEENVESGEEGEGTADSPDAGTNENPGPASQQAAQPPANDNSGVPQAPAPTNDTAGLPVIYFHNSTTDQIFYVNANNGNLKLGPSECIAVIGNFYITANDNNVCANPNDCKVVPNKFYYHLRKKRFQRSQFFLGPISKEKTLCP